jgi:hypothetical protein
LHMAFHLLWGKQRLLIRNIALSMISLAEDGVEESMPASPSEISELPHSAGWWEHRLHSALGHRMLTNGT